MGTRLKVNPAGGVLHEYLTRTKDAKGVLKTTDFVQLRPGTVFIHPDEARAKSLLALRPVVVMVTTEATEEELAKKAKVDGETARLATAEIRKKAAELVEKREATLANLEAGLRKGKPEDLAAEVKKRNLTPEGNAPEILIAAVVADERAKLEAEA